MASPLACLLLCLACALRGACGAAMGGADPPPAEEPKDPLCTAVNNEADERDFILKGKGIYTSGCYDSDISVDDDGNFMGDFSPQVELGVDLPVTYTLEMEKDNSFMPIAGGVDTMQGMLDKYVSVVSNVNCFCSRKIELPMEKLEDPLTLNKCPIFARQLPKGFPEGEYKVVVNQTTDKEEYNGIIEIFFLLENK